MDIILKQVFPMSPQRRVGFHRMLQPTHMTFSRYRVDNSPAMVGETFHIENVEAQSRFLRNRVLNGEAAHSDIPRLELVREEQSKTPIIPIVRFMQNVAT